MTDWIENVTNKNILQDNLTFASLYIAIYEHMTEYVVSNIKEFLCNFEIKDGKVFVAYAKGKEESSFTVPNGVKYITSNAFSNCTSLESITLFGWCLSHV